MVRGWTHLGVGFAVLLGLAVGCQPAGRYGPATPRATGVGSWPVFPPPLTVEPDAPKSLNTDFVWAEPTPGVAAADVPLVFVTESTDRAAWSRLPKFWNVGPAPCSAARTAALTGVGVAPWSAATALTQPPPQQVRIKVPLGLDDPTPFIPPSNPPTLAKWELGKRLFFDDALLQPAATERKLSCASCHPPNAGFTDRTAAPIPGLRSAPTLLNTVYLTSLFWDGRAAALEQVVQRVPEDERETADGLPEVRHVWPGVVRRLRDRPDYVQLFREAFGGPPTQDALGKALATYLRTALSGGSVYDRARLAVWVRSGQKLEPRDFEAALDPAALAALAEKDGDRAALAQQLSRGHDLFHGKAGCAGCHRGATFTDNDFHNAGIGESNLAPLAGQETGRFPFAPLGAKSPRLIGAYRTPTLRSLPRVGPYFHIAIAGNLYGHVAVHARPVPGPYLDPELRDRGLEPNEVRSVVLFLRALEGNPTPAVVAEPPNSASRSR
jgi:cytochrome c peroxidase